MKEITISSKEEGQKLHRFLERYFKGASQGFLYKMLRKKQIVLNEKKADGREALRNGDRIRVFFSDETFAKMQGKEDSRLRYEKLCGIEDEPDVVYEDDDILIVNKPAGILAQKAGKDDLSMNEIILAHMIREGTLRFSEFLAFCPSVANRLDRNTSGLLLAGKTLEGQQFLASELKERTAHKRYRCLVKGEVVKPERLHGYLTKDEASNTVTVTKEPRPGAKEIVTAFLPLEKSAQATLLEVELLTGRSHQIRAHLAFFGHPILGDQKYGDPAVNRQLKKAYGVTGQMLHAYSITFSDGRRFTAPEPEIFQKVLRGR